VSAGGASEPKLDPWEDVSAGKEANFEISEEDFKKRIAAMDGACNIRSNLDGLQVTRQYPRTLKAGDEAKLKQVCPGKAYYDAYLNIEGKKTCCTPDNIEAIQKFFTVLEQIIANCPACYYYAEWMICTHSCTASQARAGGETPAPKAAGKFPTVKANRVNFALLRTSVNHAQHTCKDVKQGKPPLEVNGLATLCQVTSAQCDSGDALCDNPVTLFGTKFKASCMNTTAELDMIKDEENNNGHLGGIRCTRYDPVFAGECDELPPDPPHNRKCEQSSCERPIK
jgi:hypothetical protein